MYVMGRGVPVENLSLLHPVIYLSFVAAGFAASMAIITALCSLGFGRKSSSPPPSSDSTETAKDSDAAEAENNEDDDNNNNDNNKEEEEEEEQAKELPLPPSMQQHPKDPFLSEKMKRVTSERKAPLSLSIKMPRSLSVAKNWEHLKEERIKVPKLKTEDSVWMKTIILGEKCVPDEEDDPVIYEGKGKRIAAYHTKRPSTMSVSRQGSFLDPDALSLSVPQSKTPDQTISNT